MNNEEPKYSAIKPNYGPFGEWPEGEHAVARIRERLTLGLLASRTDEPMTKIVSQSEHLLLWVVNGARVQHSPEIKN